MLALTEDLRCLQRLWQSIAERVITDAGGRRDEPMSIQHSPHRSRRATEQVDELHFPISDRRDLQQRAFEIALQLAPDGVKLHADIADPVAAGIAHPRWIAKVRCGSMLLKKGS